MSYKNEIESLFGDIYHKHALAYNYPISTRFELNEGGTYSQMFLESFDRFKQIVNFIYPQQVNLIAAVCFYEETELHKTLPKHFRKLKKQDFKLPRKYERIVKYTKDFEIYTYTYFFELELWGSEFTTLIWNTFACDLGIRPMAQLRVYFFDPDKQLIIHPYDDRGMDIIGNTKNVFDKLNKRFNKYWMSIEK